MAREPKAIKAEREPGMEIPEGHARVIVMDEAGIWLQRHGDTETRRYAKGSDLVVKSNDISGVSEDRLKVL